MKNSENCGNRALVAGGSEGIGASFATALARKGYSLTLVARRPDPLQKLAGKLSEEYDIPVRCLACDLSDEDAAEQIISFVSGEVPDIIVWNAALSYIGPFIDCPSEEHVRATRLNMITPLRIVHHFGGKMLERHSGAIILMSSMAGLQGSGYLATYAATKAFSRVLAESLWYEWKDKGVEIMACCAGASATPGYLGSAPVRASIFAPPVQMPDDVVSECFARLGTTPSFISGRVNRLASLFMHRLIPRKAAVEIMGNNTRKMYRIKD